MQVITGMVGTLSFGLCLPDASLTRLYFSLFMHSSMLQAGILANKTNYITSYYLISHHCNSQSVHDHWIWRDWRCTR
ncbi:hypothetical protein BGW36DRAFT_370082 [Talaromyces proteolyticus]|uniref:Uncharacterized protein n=1 Tax=Talaromyces proteolyticus TaxID=1131652 RepID=A0AAD4L078_9EURO|nr:uncharacterized protein BGW36DRAFT_370082 [Talaromyces proteolyticus]KAH8703838.1 hypothetical protein BGW36DRAFT_370082 [Talaromyces proteolyticus]